MGLVLTWKDMDVKTIFCTDYYMIDRMYTVLVSKMIGHNFNFLLGVSLHMLPF